MREILFRGKRVDNGEWLYGYLVKHNGRCYIYYEEPDEMCQTGNWLLNNEVIPETVGQFTGLTDKNGTKIFEGDIVIQHVRETRKGSPCLVEFRKGKFQAHYISEIRFFDRYYDINSYTKNIGNIHDNPELLKGGADK